jgi:GNAT superfamily N-acetyltransferase
MRYDAAAVAAAELHFREGIWSAAPKDAVEELEIRKRWFGPVLATACSGLPDTPLMNMVQGAAEPGAIEGGHLAEALEWMRSREVDYLVQVASDRPGSDRAEAWLADRGYEQGLTMRRYLRPAALAGEELAPEIDVRELSSAETEGMSLIFAEALELCDLATVPLLGLPDLEGWHCYTAYLEEREVACGATLIENGIAVFGLDATAPEARGRGCQTALIRRRLADAALAGCQTVLAESCEVPSDRASAGRNLQRAGFVEAGKSVGWRRPLRSTEALRATDLLR